MTKKDARAIEGAGAAELPGSEPGAPGGNARGLGAAMERGRGPLREVPIDEPAEGWRRGGSDRVVNDGRRSVFRLLSRCELVPATTAEGSMRHPFTYCTHLSFGEDEPAWPVQPVGRGGLRTGSSGSAIFLTGSVRTVGAGMHGRGKGHGRTTRRTRLEVHADTGWGGLNRR